jgi:hypothetical protein
VDYGYGGGFDTEVSPGARRKDGAANSIGQLNLSLLIALIAMPSILC